MSTTVKRLSWSCNTCQRECVPVRSESRCLCGHRLKDHERPGSGGAAGPKCTQRGCTCKHFFYIVAEGAWVLRCRCKHKHTEHDPLTHACSKAGCQCELFDSPWVCNCDHPWADHTQAVVDKQAITIADMVAQAHGAAAPEPIAGLVTQDDLQHDVSRHDLVRRGQAQ